MDVIGYYKNRTMKIIDNKKSIEKIQSLVKENKTKISKDGLKTIGIEPNEDKYKVGNILIEPGFFADFRFKIIDENRDLDGNLISENIMLHSKIKSLWEAGKKEIKFEFLIELNIYTPATELIIGNFKLYTCSDTSYGIEIVDRKKNIDGKWIDSVVNADKVISVLQKFDIKEEELEKLSEVKLNKLLEDHFKKYFESVRKGDTTNQGLIDLNIGNKKFVIELKLARELKKSHQSDRAIGQIERYMKEFTNNFMFVVAGNHEGKQEKYCQILKKKLDECGGFYYYIEAL